MPRSAEPYMYFVHHPLLCELETSQVRLWEHMHRALVRHQRKRHNKEHIPASPPPSNVRCKNVNTERNAQRSKNAQPPEEVRWLRMHKTGNLTEYSNAFDIFYTLTFARICVRRKGRKRPFTAPPAQPEDQARRQTARKHPPPQPPPPPISTGSATSTVRVLRTHALHCTDPQHEGPRNYNLKTPPPARACPA